MKKIAFVGYGNMGGTMLNVLLKAKAILEDKVIVFTRTEEKLKNFVSLYKTVEVAKSLSDLGMKCDRVFVCTGTKEVKAVLTELARFLSEDAHVISITGTIEIKCLESIYKGKISKIMPTIIYEVGEGVTLVCHNSKVLPQDKEFIETIFNRISKVKEINENQWDLGADLTSCAPAFYAAILENLVKTAKKHGDFTVDELKSLVLPTCYGTAKLLMNGNTDFQDLIARVATKGGISEEGVKVLNDQLPMVFDKLLTVTLDKRQKTKKLMSVQYGLE